MTDHDDTLEEAARALRDATEVPSPEAAATRARILAAHARRGSFLGGSTQWLAAAAVLVFFVGAPSAWALYTGRAARWLETIVGLATMEEPPALEAPAPRTPPRRPGPRLEAPLPEPVAPPPLDVTVDPPIVPLPIAPPPHEPEPVQHDEAETRPSPPLAPVLAAPASAVEPSSEVEGSSERDERIAYRRAHTLQFDARDHGAAIVAYERYLAAYPGGRFATEASYNRAVSLAHVGRRSEARDALEPFARGAHDGYREEEARELLRALQASEQQ